MRAVVVIPTYNEKENIGPLIEAIQKEFKKSPNNFKNHILVVDDSSPDGTAKEAKKKQKKFKNVHLLSNPKKEGLGGAYLKGMSYAVDKLKADVLMQFDADFSHDPKRIPEFLKAINNGSDMVLGSRYIKGGTIPDDWGFHRKFLSFFGNWTIRVVMTYFSIHDWTTGYRAIKKEVFRSVKNELNKERFFGYTFQIGFLHKAIRKGYKVSEVPINFIDRTIGKSKLGPEYVKNTLIYIIKTRIGEIMKSRIFKFAFVGGVGALVQISTLQLYRSLFPFQIAFFLAIESAVASNFIFNNIWTFSDRKLKAVQIPKKFVQFNIASAGSIIIQQIVALIGENTVGLVPLFVVPVISFNFDTGTLYAVLGILIGMFWNFFAYNKFIWKKK
ncbi:glycosyltransferase [Patescibacteria group bacterium]